MFCMAFSFSGPLVFLCLDDCTSRYMGTITGIGDLDPVRWPNSHWRSVKVQATRHTFTVKDIIVKYSALNFHLLYFISLECT